MKPGRELDALIAEKVMGCPRIPAANICKELWIPPGAPPEANIWNIEPKSYSTDIAAALEITTKICNTWVIRWYDCHCLWSVKCAHRRVVEDDCRYEAEEHTAPHAICLAALKAVGYSIP